MKSLNYAYFQNKNHKGEVFSHSISKVDGAFTLTAQDTALQYQYLHQLDFDNCINDNNDDNDNNNDDDDDDNNNNIINVSVEN